MATDRFDGQAALVTGAATGIGYEVARRIVEEGGSVALVDINGARAQESAGRLGGRALGLAADVADEPSIAGAVAEAAGRFGRLDILVNSAGITRPVAHADLDGLTDELIDTVFVNNWRGVFASIRAFAPALRASGDGLVVNVSSIAGFTGVGSSVAYCGAKAGLDVMTKSLGRALAPQIRVLGVSPGVVDTDFVPGRGKEFKDKAAAATPLKRVTSPQDVAEAIAACATSLRFSTGTSIPVDGGRHL